MFYCVLDTETTNGFESPLVYDIGWTIFDESGKIVRTESDVNADVFDDADLMSFAYFADKIPQYERDIKDGKRKKMTFMEIKRNLERDCHLYSVKAIIAHNMRFDYSACQNTLRYLTKSKYRYFLPFGFELWDSLKMAREVFTDDADYKRFCENQKYLYEGRPRMTAEILHRYLTDDNAFVESHTGLEDTLIEKDIFLECLKRGAKNRKVFDTNFLEIFNGRDSYYVESRGTVIGTKTVKYEDIPAEKYILYYNGKIEQKPSEDLIF